MPADHQPIAVVTGGGSGIGRGCALGLADAGFRVVIAGRRSDALEETAAQASNGRITAVTCDVSDSHAVHDLFTLVKREHGRLDVLLNNAGQHGPDKALEDVTLAEWQGVLEVNLTSVFLCTQHAIKMMKTQNPRGGHIINNGSMSAHTPLENGVAYTASKHGITGLTKQTNLEGRSFDITCTQLDIASCLTDMMINMEIDGPSFDVKHVAEMVVYIATRPLNVHVQNMLMYATGTPFVGRG